MAVVLGFRNQKYDDVNPLFFTIDSKFVFNRLSGKLLDKKALADEMTLEGYTPGTKEFGNPPQAWIDENGWPYEVAPPVTPPNPSTSATAGKPGSFNNDIPADLAALTGLGALGNTAAWTTGQWIVLGDASLAHWDGTAWAVGKAP